MSSDAMGNSSAQQPVPPARSNGYLNRSANQPVIGVKRKLWRKDDEHATAADEEFEKLRTETLRRDNYTCRYCGFKAAKYQEIHHFDDDHKNNSPENLLTVCTLCHQVHHIGMTAMRNAGFFASIDELTQTEVNHLVRTIHVMEHLGDEASRDKARSLFALLESRSHELFKRVFREDLSIYDFTKVLADDVALPNELYDRRAELLAPLRLVATKHAFHAGQLEYYVANNRNIFSASNCTSLYRTLENGN